jgi:FtsP/CotA-like multicopper oxidase with cupredoxin domain
MRASWVVALLLVGVAAGIGIGVIVGSDDEKRVATNATPTPKPETTVLPEDPAPFTPGQDLTEPPVITSRRSDRTLEATLVAETGTAEIGGVPVQDMQTYAAETGKGPTERTLIGPTLQVQPGDHIDLTLDNRLTVPDNASPDNDNCADDGPGSEHEHSGAVAPGEGGQPGDPQLTNLHFHGLHVTPDDTSPFGDTVVVSLHQGESKFEFDIPADHDMGTFWYHAHLHGCTDDQVFRGLAGVLLIGDSRSNLLPKDRYADIQTRTLALKDIQLEKEGKADWRIPAKHGFGEQTHRTVNGLVDPKLKIRPGELQLWRLANVSSAVWYNVALVDERRGDERDPLTIVAQDGNTLGSPRQETSLVIPPGRRFDVLVRGPKSGGRVLKTLKFDQGNAVFEEDRLATLALADAPVPEIPLPESLGKPTQRFPDDPGPTRRFTFDLDERDGGFAATIDDAQFDLSVADAAPRLETTERWILYNKSPQWHPFHIHQNDFRVVEAGAQGLPTLPGVQDIVALPPGTPAKPSRVVIEMPFTDFEGKFVFHCHILDHEDAGMMSLVDLRKVPGK